MGDDAKLFQVKFKSGHGEQVHGASADEVRALMEKNYGAEYEILSVEDITPAKK